jgi:hypothetical protein
MRAQRRVLIGCGFIVAVSMIGILLLSSVSVPSTHSRFHFIWMVSQSALNHLIGAG